MIPGREGISTRKIGSRNVKYRVEAFFLVRGRNVECVWTNVRFSVGMDRIYGYSVAGYPAFVH